MSYSGHEVPITNPAPHQDAEIRETFVSAFIAELARLLHVCRPDALAQLQMLWLQREADGDYKELVARTAWWAWQAAGARYGGLRRRES